MRVLELFSGTHSIGMVAKKLNYDVVSLDRDLGATTKFDKSYTSPNHIKCDIMTWNYKEDFKQGDFDIITASPVCLYWSILRNCWIGRKFKNSDEIVTHETLNRDIDVYGKPMVDKVFEIIEYFKPKYYWIENPKTSKMWNYIKSTWDFDDNEKFLTFDYCKYSNWGYKKPTTFLTNISNLEPQICKKDCENMIETKHTRLLDKVGGSGNRLERYRIPEKLIEELFRNCV
jgi:site-specific DNA-cytosine methylase